MNPLSRDQGVGLIPWSPLARGRLARAPEDKTARAETDPFAKRMYDPNAGADDKVIAALHGVATKRGVPHGHIALAWVLGKTDAPIVGATKMSHLEDAV